MKVRLFSGSLRLVEKSGVGKAVHHQEAMLRSQGVEVTFRRDRQAEFIHINTVFPDSLAAALCARARGQKVIYYGHSTMEDFRNSFKGSNLLAPLFKRWIKLCYSTGDAIITPTEYSRRLLLSYGIKKPIYALSNGIDTDFFCPNAERRKRFREKYKLTTGVRAVMSVGHYIGRKGIAEFIELARLMPDTRFFWFGYTDPRLIPAEINAAISNAPENLCLAGFVGEEELCDAYCGCDLFCFMSHEETEGIVVLEALACSVPVLVRDIPVYGGWLIDGENCRKADDLDSFRHTAADMLAGQNHRLTAAGRRTALSRGIAEMGRRLCEIYRDVLAASGKAVDMTER